MTIVPGRASLTTGDSAGFTAELRDSAGSVLFGRTVSWLSSDTSVLVIESPSGAHAVVRARGAGTASVRATSEGKSGEATITVAAPIAVATVTVVPGSADLAVGDSVGFVAEFRDAAGNLLTNRGASWFSTDTTVITVYYPSGQGTTVRARAPGTAILRATSEGKIGEAAITVR